MCAGYPGWLQHNGGLTVPVQYFYGCKRRVGYKQMPPEKTLEYIFWFPVINFFIQILYPCSYYRFLVTGFMCQMPGLFRKRGTLTPPVLISRPRCMGETDVYSMHRDIMHCCVGYRSGMRTKAMPPACFFCTEYPSSGTETVRYPVQDN